MGEDVTRCNSRYGGKSRCSQSRCSGALRARLAIGVVVASALLGCASRPARPTPNPDVINAEQIVRANAGTAYELIARTRPQMFTPHGAPTTRGPQGLPPVVYMDGLLVGPLAELHRISVLDLIEVRYVSPRQATDRWGVNHSGGAILLTTRKVVDTL